MKHHDKARIAVSAVAISTLLISVAPAFAAISSGALASTNREPSAPAVDLSVAIGQLMDAKQSMQQTLPKLQEPDTAKSTLDFGDIISELKRAGLIADEPGRLVSIYVDKGAEAAFRQINTMLDEAIDDANLVQTLHGESDQLAANAVAVAQAYQVHGVWLQDFAALLFDANRRSKDVPSLPRVAQATDEMRAVG